MVKKGDSKTSKVNFAVPFSLRDTTMKPEDFQLQNDFVSISLVLDLEEDFKLALEKVKKRMTAIKKSLIPSGMYYFMKIA